jgi:hypothetical protein
MWWTWRRFGGNSCRDQAMVETLHEPNIDGQTLARIFGSLGSRFGDAALMRMSYRDVQIFLLRPRQLTVPPNACRPFEIHNSSSGPSLPCGIVRCHCEASAPPVLVFCKTKFASTMLGRQLPGFSATRSSVCHEPANIDSEFKRSKSALSWMRRHFNSFRLHDAANDYVICRLVGNIPPMSLS